MGWIVPSLGSLAAGAADDAILRERRERRRRTGRTPTPRVVPEDEQALIDSIIRLPVHVRVEPVRRPSFRGRRDQD